MRSNRARMALFDIRDNIHLAQQFVAGMTEEEFAADRRTFYAVARCLEIISEAAPAAGCPQPASRVAVARHNGSGERLPARL
jgi:uncharacterized protein with HEPN domain